MGRLADSLRSFWLGEIPSRDPALARYFGYGPSSSGVNVTEWTALNYSAWWAAVQCISGAIASVPLVLYKRLKGGGKERLTSHPVYELLHDNFNPEMTSSVARETMQAHVLSWGNAYAEIERSVRGEPLALWPIAPNLVRPERRTTRGALVYRVRREDGTDAIIPADDMLHVPGLGFDGICGYSVVRMARESIGLGLGTEKFGARFFGTGANFSIIAMHPARLSQPARDNLEKSITAKHAGVDQSHQVLILEENMKVEKVGIPPEDSQFLESRQFQVAEVARWFNIPPHKLADLLRATFSNIESQGIDFLTQTLMRWFVRWEQELKRKLVRPLERSQQLVEHIVDGFLRGDTQSRYNAYAVGRQWGWLSADDIRERENMNPLPDGQGKIYLVPQNMAPADQADQLIKAPEPAPRPEPPPEPPARALPDPAVAAKIIAAQRAMFIETLGRMVRKEGNAARRASRKDAEAFRLWIASFYRKHESVLGSAILPAMTAHLSHVGSPKDPAVETQALVARYVEASRAELHRLVDEYRDDLEAAVEGLVSRWESERPLQVADAVMVEELAHAIGGNGAWCERARD